MTLANFIDRLSEIQNQYDCDNVIVTTMQEKELGEIKTTIIQIESEVQDIAVSIGKDGVKKIIIIGNEID